VESKESAKEPSDPYCHFWSIFSTLHHKVPNACRKVPSVMLNCAKSDTSINLSQIAKKY
jgi:hypothetical protein